MYVANIDGGLASQQSIQLPSCEGEACRGAGTPPPPPAPPASASFNGVGNKPQTNPGCAKGKRKVKGRCVLKHKKRHAHKRHSKARSQRGGSK
jgi:hypothetical protein